MRFVTPKLPEPEGPRDGVTGQGPVLRLLIAGDSAAAGVGATTLNEGLCGQLVQRLSQRFTVHWQLNAVTGLDSPGLEQLLSALAEQSFDVVVLSIGVNDVTKLMAPNRWVQWQERLAQRIHTHHHPQLIIHSAIPPMHGFTALPQPLRWFMGQWALAMNRRLEAALDGGKRRALHWPFQDAAPDGLATDGFHPGPIGYVIWADGLSKLIQLKQSSWKS